MTQVQMWLTLFLNFASVIGVFFIVYNHFRRPDLQASDRIGKIETSCPLRHDKLDYVVNEIKNSIKTLEQSVLLIKENDIKHIEQEMRIISERQGKILAILEMQNTRK